VSALVDAAKARVGRPVLLTVRPWSDRSRDEPGRCSACGCATTFTFNRWVIPDDLRAAWGDPAVGDAYARRESMFCRRCCASLRVRRFSEVLLSLYGPGLPSVAALVRDPGFRALDVAEINTIGSMGSLHAQLRQLPRLAFSEYAGPDRLGKLVDGVRNEDVSRLTYPDASFDLLLSSDTLEHVPDFGAALRESRRVLRTGGRHLFTVPIVATRPTTETRATLGPSGAPVHHMPPLFHGRGAGLYRHVPVGADMLTFTEFGRDLVDHIAAAGLEPEVFARDDDPIGAQTVFAGRAPG
jgi:SAM-dependent methyltransferase